MHFKKILVLARFRDFNILTVMFASCFLPSKHHAFYLPVIVNEVTDTEV